jgi:putative DNA methylase
MTVKSPKKLIEVALPLDIINAACSREKSIRHGHPSTLHLWWARRPPAAARSVIFSQMVNDPSWKWEMEHPGQIPPQPSQGFVGCQLQAAVQDYRKPGFVGEHHQ